jgi:transcriptional regulator
MDGCSPSPLDLHRKKELPLFARDAAALQGTVELLVLKRLSWGPMHGYGIARWIETATDDVLRVEEGSLYPALYRMIRKGWIKGEWGTSDNNRRAKFYRLTKAGQRQLEEQANGWLRLSQAVSRAVTAKDL